MCYRSVILVIAREKKQDISQNWKFLVYHNTAVTDTGNVVEEF